MAEHTAIGEAFQCSPDTEPTELQDISNLPHGTLVVQDERKRVACVVFDRMFTAEEYEARLSEFLDKVAPGHSFRPAAYHRNSDHTKRELWKPFAITQMPSPVEVDYMANSETFDSDFIHDELRGVEWSPGYFFIPTNRRTRDRKFTAYWVLDAAIEPYLPKKPGEHGAKLTPFFNTTLAESGKGPTEDDDYNNTPVFVAEKDSLKYKYFGTYSQTRFSDRLDYERVVDGTVPPFVLDVWAKHLTQKDLQPWVKDALREHIWPRPVYRGSLPLNTSVSSSKSTSRRGTVCESFHARDRRLEDAMSRYLDALQAWEEETNLKVSLLKEADIHRLFRAADADDEAGLRFWFEYLQCTSYDHGLYERLMQLQDEKAQHDTYAQVFEERLRQGWQWRLVPKVSESGHEHMARELCPPRAKSKPAAVRRDSVVSVARVRVPSASRERIETKGTGRTDSMAVAALDAQISTAKDDDTGSVISASTVRTSIVPPHLRKQQHFEKVAQEQVTSPSPPPHKSNNDYPITTTDLAAAEPVLPSLQAAGDLEAAKRMRDSFTKAQPRPTRGKGNRNTALLDRQRDAIQRRLSAGGAGYNDPTPPKASEATPAARHGAKSEDWAKDDKETGAKDMRMIGGREVKVKW